ncbi:MAG: enoyl-CoA hydratase-related protein [Bacteroidales bacterium]|jgi:enoyl-CoA hydratase
MDYQILKPQQTGRVGLLTISRPANLNALNSLFFTELVDYLDYIITDEPFEVLVITGEGKAFSAGADISEMAGLTPEGARRFSERGQQSFLMLEDLPIPVIAAVNGYALGAGCELSMACDIRLASVKAQFGQPEVSLGLVPGYAGTQRLSRLIGLGGALKWILSGLNMDASEAYRIGLVQDLSEPDKLLEDALTLARRIATRGPKAVRTAKILLRKGIDMNFQKALDMEKEHFADLFNDEGLEGMKAFLEKRKPSWDQEK